MASYRVVGKAAKKLSSTKTKLTSGTVNPAVARMKNNMKSEVHTRYMKHVEEMKRGMVKPFHELVRANSGDSQSHGQPPVTFMRQLLALCIYPQFADIVPVPEDVEYRIKRLRAEMPRGNCGSLRTEPQGLLSVRKQAAEYIRERDGGAPVRPENIFLNDCCKCVDTLMSLIAADDKDGLPAGVMVPVPGYPVYPALVAKHRMRTIGYYLHERRAWEPNIREMRKLLKTAKRKCRPRAVVVINPGNPTGQILSKEILEDIMALCLDEDMMLIADEVYQQNVYGTVCEFHSLKKIKTRLGKPYRNVQIASVNSASKGFLCECGLRGGYAELEGFDEDLKEAFLKTIATHGPPNLAGQIAMSVCTDPPRAGDPSYETYNREKTAILEKMALKASLLADRLGAVKGIRVRPVRAGLYAYATILSMPAKAVAKARCFKMDATMLWALQLLDKSGIAVVPGCNFLQMPGKYHFRVTLAPTVETIEKIAKGINRFHRCFLQTYK